MPLPSVLLLIDDAVAILIVTMLGLRFHQIDAVLWERLPFTFFPFFLTWLLAAAALKLYQPQTAGQWAQLWRVPLVAGIAALPAAALRALWLGKALGPRFLFFMGGGGAPR